MSKIDLNPSQFELNNNQISVLGLTGGGYKLVV